MKSLGKKLFKRLNLIYKYVENDFDMIKTWQKTARTLDKSLIKNSLIHKSINKKNKKVMIKTLKDDK